MDARQKDREAEIADREKEMLKLMKQQREQEKEQLRQEEERRRLQEQQDREREKEAKVKAREKRLAKEQKEREEREQNLKEREKRDKEQKEREHREKERYEAEKLEREIKEKRDQELRAHEANAMRSYIDIKILEFNTSQHKRREDEERKTADLVQKLNSYTLNYHESERENKEARQLIQLISLDVTSAKSRVDAVTNDFVAFKKEVEKKEKAQIDPRDFAAQKLLRRQENEGYAQHWEALMEATDMQASAAMKRAEFVGTMLGKEKGGSREQFFVFKDGLNNKQEI
jgi:hypothetical protein